MLEASLSDTRQRRSQDGVRFQASGVAIEADIAFVADGSSGLQAANYLPFDTKGIPTTASISFPASEIVGTDSRGNRPRGPRPAPHEYLLPGPRQGKNRPLQEHCLLNGSSMGNGAATGLRQPAAPGGKISQFSQKFGPLISCFLEEHTRSDIHVRPRTRQADACTKRLTWDTAIQKQTTDVSTDSIIIQRSVLSFNCSVRCRTRCTSGSHSSSKPRILCSIRSTLVN